MSDSYDWSTFTLHMHYHAPRKDLWQLWTTSAGLERFLVWSAAHNARTSGRARGYREDVETGDSYLWVYWHGLQLRGTFDAVEPERRIAFSLAAMHVDVTLEDVGDALRLRLVQTGCRPDDEGRVRDHLDWRTCWAFALTNLKSVVEHGRDLREPEHPEWNHSVSVDWSPAARPGADRVPPGVDIARGVEASWKRF